MLCSPVPCSISHFKLYLVPIFGIRFFHKVPRVKKCSFTFVEHSCGIGIKLSAGQFLNASVASGASAGIVGKALIKYVRSS